MAQTSKKAVKRVLESSWKTVLAEELLKPYIKDLQSFYQAEKESGKVLYPKAKDIFNAFTYTPFEQVKVVLLGQDPYHGPNQAHGLSFSVKPGVKIPPSLLNIYKELASDLDLPLASHGCLESWAKQGVLLLNSVLTVEEGLPASHQGKGWERFTDRVIQLLNAQQKPIVFILWGSYAQQKGSLIDNPRHLVIRSVHPSPLSAHRGFFGSKPFSKTNEYLKMTGQKAINWGLS